MTAFDAGREDWEEPDDPRVRVAYRLIGAIVAAFSLLGLCAIATRAGELPDPALTPGVVASTDPAEVCGYVGGLSYSARHRKTTVAMKAAVAREYGAARCGEIDHRVELSLGGADVPANLWCQPGPPVVWNFRLKDRLEAYVWRTVCRQHTMNLAAGQAIFLAPDWRVAYCQYIKGPPCPP